MKKRRTFLDHFHLLPPVYHCVLLTYSTFDILTNKLLVQTQLNTVGLKCFAMSYISCFHSNWVRTKFTSSHAHTGQNSVTVTEQQSN